MKKISILITFVVLLISCTKTDFGKDIAELKSQVSLLQSQIGILQKTTDSLNNELKLTKSQITVMNGKIDSLYKKIDLVNTQIGSLTSELNSKISTLSSQTVTQQNETSKSILDLISQITTLQKELSDLTKQISAEKALQIQLLGYEIVPVDSRLKSTGEGVITVPVVIINYLPTLDGVYLDKYKTINSNGTWNDSYRYSIERAKTKILTEKIIEKKYIEQGTRYHDYGTNTVKPYVNIDVVAYINVSDIKYVKVDSSMVDTLGNGTKVKSYFYRLDFNELLTRINLKNYVENLGVKEVWFTSFTKEIGEYSYGVPESNMAGPYGNISNGGLPNIPTYNKTYVMYGFNGWRGVDTDLHNRGHQIERQMKELDYNTWLNFTKGNAGIITHWAPNSLNSYEYGNKSFAKSDIQTWKPSGGTLVDVNVYTWLNKTYSFESQINMIAPGAFATGIVDYSKDISYPNANQLMGATTEVKYHVFWWQSMPGYQNGIVDGGKTVTNWWDIFYNWDDAKRTGKKLLN